MPPVLLLSSSGSSSTSQRALCSVEPPQVPSHITPRSRKRRTRVAIRTGMSGIEGSVDLVVRRPVQRGGIAVTALRGRVAAAGAADHRAVLVRDRVHLVAVVQLR